MTISRRLLHYFGASALIALATGCGSSSDDQENKPLAEKAEVKAVDDEMVQPVTEQIGTPMAERVATLGFLNKRNGLTRDIELRPGQSIRIGRAIVRLRACERAAPWELTPEHGAFVQLLVNERQTGGQSGDNWKKVFSGWLFRESPSLNVVEHPVYDVWVKRCAMSFPGEDDSTKDVPNITDPRSASSNLANSASNVRNESAERMEAAEPIDDPDPPSAPAPAPQPEPEPEPVAPPPAPEPQPEFEPEPEFEEEFIIEDGDEGIVQ